MNALAYTFLWQKLKYPRAGCHSEGSGGRLRGIRSLVPLDPSRSGRPLGRPPEAYCRAIWTASSSVAFSWKLTNCFTTVPFRSTKNIVGKTLTVP